MPLDFNKSKMQLRGAHSNILILRVIASKMITITQLLALSIEVGKKEELHYCKSITFYSHLRSEITEAVYKLPDSP